MEYIPDLQKLMVATPEANRASLKTTMTFKNGVLGDANAEGDGSIVPKAIMSAIQTAAPQFLAALNVAANTPGHSVPAPYLYKILVSDDDIRFIGTQGTTDINITILPQEETKTSKD